MKRLLGVLVTFAVLSPWGSAGDFVGLDAANQILYDIDSQTGRVLALRKLVAPPGLVLGAMDYGIADAYNTQGLLVAGTFPPTDRDIYSVSEDDGAVAFSIDLEFGPGGGDAGVALGTTQYLLSSTPTGATLEAYFISDPGSGHNPILIGSVSGQEAFGIGTNLGAQAHVILKDASGSRLAEIIGSGPLDQSIVGPITGLDDSLGFSLQEHPTQGLLYLFSPGDEALYTIDVATAATSLVSPLPGSAELTSFAPRTRSDIEFCFGGGELEPGCGGCPCSNDAQPGTRGGCLNSAQRSARLWRSGAVTPSSDTLRFQVTQLPPSTFAILLAGQSALPLQGPCPLGSGVLSASLDGIRCVGNGVVRLGTRASTASGQIGLNNPGWGGPTDPGGDLGAPAGVSSGQTRYFQAFYRDDTAFGCGSGLNTTQAVAVVGE